MAHNKYTCSSSSGKVEYAVTNHVAFMEKESVHADFHPLMDFLKHSSVSYALTANPTIYAEIVQEMWSRADCSTKGEIKFTVKGKSYTITSSVINEALHLPNSNFENLPTDEEIISLLNYIKYASETSHLGQISRKYLRKEWSYFFDTLTKVFTGKCGGYDAIIRFVQKIAYSLMYNRTIDIGSLLLNEFSIKLGNIEKRSKVIYYARFFMIIANHLCKDLSIKNKDDKLQVCVQSKALFSHLVKNNFHGKVNLVLPQHIQVQLSTLSSSPSRVPPQSQSGTQATSSVSQNGKRKKTTLRTITTYYKSTNVGGSEKDETAAEVHPPQKKMAARRLFDVNHEMPPRETRDGVPVVEFTSPEEENPKCDLSPLEPALKPNSQEEVLPEDRQHLVNAASVLKSQLVARLTSSAEKLRTEDMIDLAQRCYNALRELGDDYTSFRREVYKLTAQHQKLEYAAKQKDDWNDQGIKDRYNKQVVSLSDETKKFSSAEDKLSRAKTKREELKGALLKLTEELSEEEERVKTLTAERNICKEAHSDVEVEFEKLVAEKKEAYVAFEQTPSLSPSPSPSPLPSPSPSPSPSSSPSPTPSVAQNPEVTEPSFPGAPSSFSSPVIFPGSNSWESKRSSSSKRHLAITLSAALGGTALLLLLASGIYFCRSNKVSAVRPWATGLSGQLQKAFVTGVPNLKRTELEAACEDFSNVIGSSSMGTVYKGTLSTGVEIAVTSLAVESAKEWPENLEAQFRKKIYQLSRVNHKNFVNLIGYCEEDKPFTRMVVFEYAPNGTLFEHLHISEAEHLDWGMRMRIVMGIAYCLEHLHQLKPPIPHRNLNSSAVNLTEDYAAKLSDFGLWNEIASKDMQASPESNVYSFGVILFELVTGRLPYMVENFALEDWASDYLKGEQPLRGMVDQILTSFDADQIDQIGEVIKSCCHYNPKQRPTMKNVTARLKEITRIRAEEAVPRLSPLWWAELEIISTEGL